MDSQNLILLILSGFALLALCIGGLLSLGPNTEDLKRQVVQTAMFIVTLCIGAIAGILGTGSF